MDIVPGPTFTTQPQDDQACVGVVISALSISYTNGSGSPQYQWYENTVNNNTTGTWSQEQLVVVIRLVQLLLVMSSIITVLLIYHRVDVILFIPIQPRLLLA